MVALECMDLFSICFFFRQNASDFGEEKQLNYDIK